MWIGIPIHQLVITSLTFFLGTSTKASWKNKKHYKAPIFVGGFIGGVHFISSVASPIEAMHRWGSCGPKHQLRVTAQPNPAIELGSVEKLRCHSKLSLILPTLICREQLNEDWNVTSQHFTNLLTWMKLFRRYTPWKFTFWTEKLNSWKMMFLFKHVIFRFRINFQGCKWTHLAFTRPSHLFLPGLHICQPTRLQARWICPLSCGPRDPWQKFGQGSAVRNQSKPFNWVGIIGNN